MAKSGPPTVRTTTAAKSHRPVLSRRKKLLFALGTVLVVGLLAEGGLWLFGVRPALFERDPYIGFSSSVPLFTPQTVDGQAVMRTASNKREFFHDQQFPQAKAPGTFRIFCVGGSTTHGQPFGDEVAFAGWLRAMLPVADPARRWEVINAGGISYASYRVALLLEELAKYQPDLIVVYSGQNEFLEARTYGELREIPALVRSAGGLASRLRTFTALQAAAAKLRGSAEPPAAATTLEDRVVTKLDSSIGPQAYQRDDAQRQVVVDHFRYNLARMADIARSAGAGMIVVTPATNLRDCKPFLSQFGESLSLEQQQQVIRHLEAGAKLGGEEKLAPALAEVDAAIALDPRYAESHHLRGTLLFALDRFADAKAAFERAREEDVCPLRAIAPIRAAVQEVAAERNLPVVDFATWAEAQSPHGITGEQWFVDHIHPTIEGNRQLALQLLAEMQRQGYVQPTADWNDAAIAKVKQQVESRLDNAAHGVALRNLAKVMQWAGKYEEGLRAAERAIERAPQDGEAYFVAGSCQKRLHQTAAAIKWYQAAIDHAPATPKDALPPTWLVAAHLNLGMLLEGKPDLTGAAREFKIAIGIGRGDDQIGARVMLARVLIAQGAPDEAREQLTKVLAERPDYADAHTQMGIICAQNRQPAEATKHFREAQRLAPDHPTTLGNLGTALLAEQQFNEGISLVARAAERTNDPRGRAVLYRQLAHAYDQIGRGDQAVASLRAALQVDPESDACYENLVRLLVRRRQPEEAEKLLGETLRVATRNAAMFLAWSSAVNRDPKVRDPERAVRWAERVAQASEGKSFEALDILGVAYAAAGRFEEAEKQAAAAVTLARAQRQLEMVAQIEARRKLFANRKAYTE